MQNNVSAIILWLEKSSDNPHLLTYPILDTSDSQTLQPINLIFGIYILFQNLTTHLKKSWYIG